MYVLQFMTYSKVWTPWRILNEKRNDKVSVGSMGKKPTIIVAKQNQHTVFIQVPILCLLTTSSVNTKMYLRCSLADKWQWLGPALGLFDAMSLCIPCYSAFKARACLKAKKFRFPRSHHPTLNRRWEQWAWPKHYIYHRTTLSKPNEIVEQPSSNIKKSFIVQKHEPQSEHQSQM